MAGLFGIGGSAAKTDRKQQLSSWGDLQSIFGATSTLGQGQAKQGAANLGTASDYFNAIASGDPSKMSTALAPQISAIKNITSQGVNTLNQFGTRSGGTAGAVSEEGIAAQQAVQNLFDLLGPEAMAEVANLGANQETLGTGQEQLATEAAGTVGAQASGSRQQTVPLQQAQQSGVIDALSSLGGLA
jgi:hypothetical protein